MNLIIFLICIAPLQEKAPKLVKSYPVIKEMQESAMKSRKKNSLKSLKLDENCCIIAQRWANYMAQNNYFEHGGGEQIIAYGYSNADNVMSGWMNSLGHRYWMLSNSKYCGWGCQISKNGTKYWVGVFRDKIPKVKPWNESKTKPIIKAVRIRYVQPCYT